MGRNNHPGREDEKTFYEKHNQVVAGAHPCLAAGLQVLHFIFPVYTPLCALGMSSTQRRQQIRGEQQKQDRRCQSPLALQEPSCLFQSVSLGLPELRMPLVLVTCWLPPCWKKIRTISDVGVSSLWSEPQSPNQYRHACCVCLQASLFQKGESPFIEMGA